MASQGDSTYPIYVVDAFTEKRFGGNPAAVVPLPAKDDGSGWLPDETLLTIAAENNLSETAFLLPDTNASSQPCYELRWFTPVVEIALCGHATLASAYTVATVLETDAEVITFRSRQSGILTAKVKRPTAAAAAAGGEEASSLQIELSFPALKPDVEVKDEELIKLATEAIGCPLKSLVYCSTDLNYNQMAVLASADAVKAVRPDFAKVAKLHKVSGLIVTAAVTDSDADEYRDAGVDFVSRYFAPNAGIDEDPVTGSAHCVSTPYWADKLGKKDLHARQISARVGTLFVSHEGDRVLLRGSAALYLEGRIHV